MAGRLAPGMHLAQGDLAAKMGISRVALREGLRISAGGLVPATSDAPRCIQPCFRPMTGGFW